MDQVDENLSDTDVAPKHDHQSRKRLEIHRSGSQRISAIASLLTATSICDNIHNRAERMLGKINKEKLHANYAESIHHLTVQ